MADGGKRELIVRGGEPRTEKPSAQPSISDCTISAHLLGQDGRKRGLKAGTPVLSQAKTAYLEAEWSGPADRRVRLGRNAKTEV